MIWAATHPAGRNQAFNTANGDVFRWRWLWPQLADCVRPARGRASRAKPRTLESQMVGMEDTWREIAAKYSLVEPDLGRLASWWHTDADLGRTIEVITDMTKSRLAGFLGFRSTPASFLAPDRGVPGGAHRAVNAPARAARCPHHAAAGSRRGRTNE